MKLLPEITFVILIAVYSYVITHKMPKRYYSLSNLLVAATTVGASLLFGITVSDLGLSTNTIISGILYGLAFSIPIIIAVIFIATRTPFNKHFSHAPKKQFSRSKFIYEVGFRIPFGTALSEEVIFRGALMALLSQNYSFTVAAILSSLIFGLWHIFPTLHTNKSNDPLINYMDDQRKRSIIAVVAAVVATSILGFVLTIINNQSQSLVSSWIIHSSINGFAVLGGYITVWIQSRKSA